MNKYLIPFDVFERHKFIAGLLKGSKSVLDVGGGVNTLSSFLKNSEITVINLKGAEEFNKTEKELTYDGKHIPFAGNHFNSVVSVDVLEHIPKKERSAFVTELLRVSIDRVIISAPLGTQKHINYEKEMLLKNNIKYLSEHVELGLPTLEELKSYSKDYKYNLYFSGNLALVKFLFNLHNSEINLPVVNKLYYCLKIMINFKFNLIGYKFLTNLKYSENINRVYLVIYK